MTTLQIKSLSVDKGIIRYEIHRKGCSDVYKNDPIQVWEVLDEKFCLLMKDIGEEVDFQSYRETYRIMPCVKE